MTRVKLPGRLAATLAAAVALSAVIALLNPGHGVQPWSLGTAYAAFVLIAITLVIGPLNVLRKKSNPIHSSLRRDVGISAGIMSVVHTLIGLQVHMNGSLARYFLAPPPPVSARGTLFVAANWLGLVSVIALAVVTVVSNNPSLRRLGLHKWKMVQRLVYPAAILAVAHAFAYQALEGRAALAILLVAVASGLVVGLQIAGMRAKRSPGASRRL